MANKTESMSIRVTEKDRIEINKRIPLGYKFSEWARLKLLGSRLQKKTILSPPKVDKQLVQSLDAIGRNINQIARYVNTFGYTDAVKMYQVLISIERDLEQIKIQNSRQIESEKDDDAR